jgi:hypothetical protein
VGAGGFGAKGCGDDNRFGDLLLRRFSSARLFGVDVDAVGHCVVDGLEWTIVRAPRLTNGPLTKIYSVADGRLPKGMTVSRACVADFMIKEAERTAHVRQIVGLSK